MDDNVPQFMATLLEALNKTKLNNNQVADITGFSRPYVFSLRTGKIKQISRDKLIILLLLALNYTFSVTNQILRDFGYEELTAPDSSTLIGSIRKRSFTETQPVRSTLHLETMLLATENIIGDNAAVFRRPDAALASFEAINGPPKIESALDELLITIRKAIHVQRQDAFKANLKYGRQVQTGVCSLCLKDYIQKSDNQEGVREHIDSLIRCLKEYDNYKLHIFNVCPRFWFKLKVNTFGKDSRDTLLIAGNSVHGNERDPGKDDSVLGQSTESYDNTLLSGFVTGDSNIVTAYKMQFDHLVNYFSINTLIGKSLEDYIISLFKSAS